MLDFDLLKDCYGCGACVNVCPRGAAHMTQAADGSYIPEIDEARCIGCGKCEQHCPQHLPIRQELKNARKALEGIPYRIGRKVLPHIMHY